MYINFHLTISIHNTRQILFIRVRCHKNPKLLQTPAPTGFNDSILNRVLIINRCAEIPDLFRVLHEHDISRVSTANELDIMFNARTDKSGIYFQASMYFSVYYIKDSL
jgi:hypothetical protein